MGFMRVFGTLLVPALIATALYLLGVHVLVPLIRRHRERYSQYLPLNTLSNSSSSLRQGVSGFFSTWIVPLFRGSTWRRRQVVSAEDGEGNGDGISSAPGGNGSDENNARGGRGNAFRSSVESDDEAVLFSNDVGDRMTGFGFGNGRRPN